MDIPLIGGDKIRSLIKNATKDSSTWSNESLIKTNTRDSNNLIKDSNQLEMDRKKAFIAIMVGIVMASIIMMIISYGFVAKLINY